MKRLVTLAAFVAQLERRGIEIDEVLIDPRSVSFVRTNPLDTDTNPVDEENLA